MFECEILKQKLIERSKTSVFSLEELLVNNGYYKCLNKKKEEKIEKTLKEKLQDLKDNESKYIDCKYCNGEGGFECSVETTFENAMWVDEGVFMELGFEKCKHCKGIGKVLKK